MCILQMEEKSHMFRKALYGGGGTAIKPVGPDFDGYEPATRWKGIK